MYLKMRHIIFLRNYVKEEKSAVCRLLNLQIGFRVGRQVVEVRAPLRAIRNRFLTGVGGQWGAASEILR